MKPTYHLHLFAQRGQGLLKSCLVCSCCLLNTAAFAANPQMPAKTKQTQQVARQTDLLKHLATASLPAQLLVHFSWAGLSATHPIENYNLQFLASSQQYQVTGKRQLISNRNNESKDQQVNLKLTSAVVTDLLKELDRAPWTPAKEPARVISHTDDYPNFSVAFKLKPQHTVKLFSVSNPRNFVPWNLVIDDQIYTSPDPEVGIAVLTFFSYLRETRKTS